MTFSTRKSTLALAAMLVAPAVQAQSELNMPQDSPMMVAGIDAACTGIAESAEDPRWAAYPTRIEFAGGYNQWLIGARVTVASEASDALFTVRCGAPWLLLKLEPGRYRVTAELLYNQAAPQSATISPPATGQQRFVFRFPEVTGDN